MMKDEETDTRIKTENKVQEEYRGSRKYTRRAINTKEQRTKRTQSKEREYRRLKKHKQSRILSV